MGFSIPAYIIVLSTLKKPTHGLSKGDHFYLFLLGFAGYYLASFLDFKGLTYIKASLERLILFIYPTLVIILSAVLLKKRISKIQKVGVAVTYLGIAIVFGPELLAVQSVSEAAVIKGGTLVFFSALFYSLYLVGSQWLIPKFGVRRFTAIAMLWSGGLVFVHYALSSDVPLVIFDWSPKVYILGALMGIVSTILPSFLISQGIHRLGAAQFSILAALGPVSTISLAYIFLDERLSILQFAGSVIIICGVLIAEYFGKKATT
jgi:drug/metabolite transporter (DMT)-like permease